MMCVTVRLCECAQSQVTQWWCDSVTVCVCKVITVAQSSHCVCATVCACDCVQTQSHSLAGVTKSQTVRPCDYITVRHKSDSQMFTQYQAVCFCGGWSLLVRGGSVKRRGQSHRCRRHAQFTGPQGRLKTVPVRFETISEQKRDEKKPTSPTHCL